MPVQSQVTFTPANWNIPQLITVNGVNDSPPLSDGTQTVTIVTENISSTDVHFGAITNANAPFCGDESRRRRPWCFDYTGR